MVDRTTRRVVVPVSVLVLLVAATVAVEPRLRHIGVTGIVERFDAFRCVAGLAFGVPGVLVVAQRPASRVGWLMTVIGAAQAVGVALGAYGLLGINDGGLPGDDWAMWVSNWIWVPAYLAVPTVLLLIFPDGRLPSRRWRPALAVAIAGIVMGAVDWILQPVTLLGEVGRMYPPGYEGVFAHLTGVPPAVRTAGTVCSLISVAAALASLVIRYRRSDERMRRRLQWVVAGALLTVSMLGLALLVPWGAPIVALACVPLPAGVAVAVVAHRLWDLDLLLSRALAFGAVSVLLLAGYALTAFTVGGVLGAGASAILVAFAVHPLYLRASTAANRLVYGDRDDPARALRRLGARLSDAGAPGDLLERMAAEVGRVLRVHYVAVEDHGVVVASWGASGEAGERVLLHHQGHEVGTLLVGERLRPKDRALLAELAPHVAVAVHAHRLGADLERSHARLLAARQEERDRLLYELHDGVGPTLAALALQLDRGRRLVDTDPQQAKHIMDDLSARIRATVGNVRAIVNDLRPPPLDDLGLAGALAELGKGFAGDLAVEVDTPSDLPALSAPIELATYRIAAEALTNAARHARASHCIVRLRAHQALELHIDDDGIGLASPARHGFGLTSMRRRSEELGGTFELHTGDGTGTHLVVRLPLAAS
ncbi:sensor histidine kinase [Planotetraspora sp. A-T 1434]|uniref:sensor histidine kinase n=1 Tax=Planotetraspora sp. A-T 1434 TaxID=2979219 RepID=UPI0021BE05FB|nr:sensor histidine kinase [Planotetraspora sp. A-T 1434]MCT9929791.1 sensor histidine kinase [Planotetraspora sp. A-T 1434]